MSRSWWARGGGRRRDNQKVQWAGETVPGDRSAVGAGAAIGRQPGTRIRPPVRTDRQDKIGQVREGTGQGYQECRRALSEAGGDAGRAVDLIRLRGEMYTVDAREAVFGRFKKGRGAEADD